jgi:hypothetical protein
VLVPISTHPIVGGGYGDVDYSCRAEPSPSVTRVEENMKKISSIPCPSILLISWVR